MARWRKQPFEISKLKLVFETGWLDQGSVIDWDGEEPEQKILGLGGVGEILH